MPPNFQLQVWTNWGVSELKLLAAWAPSLFNRLARLLTVIEDLGIWPEVLAQRAICFIPKDMEDADSATQHRPITILSATQLIGFGPLSAVTSFLSCGSHLHSCPPCPPESRACSPRTTFSLLPERPQALLLSGKMHLLVFLSALGVKQHRLVAPRQVGMLMMFFEPQQQSARIRELPSGSRDVPRVGIAPTT